LILFIRLKKDKEEQFKKRAMGEKTYTKQDKEIMRKRNQQVRDEYDMQNLGDYKLVYPVKNDPVFLKID
jgi:hypothetical protein